MQLSRASMVSIRPSVRVARAILGITLASLVLGAGCPIDVTPGTEDNGNADGYWPPASNLRTTGEPNDTFNEPLDIVLSSSDTGRISGTIPTSDDVDVYKLSGLRAGDRLIVDVSALDSGMDATCAVFDGEGLLVYENDDRDVNSNQLDPSIDFIVRHESTDHFVAIAPSPLGSTDAKSGSYGATIQVVRSQGVPATASQVISLDTDGGSAIILNQTYTVGAFDTADIDTAYAGMTEAVLDQIVATVEENYGDLQLQVLVTSRDSTPGGCTASTVLLGGYNPRAFGLADKIDNYNEDHCDAAIIFTEMFTPAHFGNNVLSTSELGTAIGNVVTHEVGHLLGLNHVANYSDLMDTTGPSNTFLMDQVFTTSPLHDKIFPIGDQDGWLLLLETLGLAN